MIQQLVLITIGIVLPVARSCTQRECGVEGATFAMRTHFALFIHPGTVAHLAGHP